MTLSRWLTSLLDGRSSRQSLWIVIFLSFPVMNNKCAPSEWEEQVLNENVCNTLHTDKSSIWHVTRSVRESDKEVCLRGRSTTSPRTLSFWDRRTPKMSWTVRSSLREVGGQVRSSRGETRSGRIWSWDSSGNPSLGPRDSVDGVYRSVGLDQNKLCQDGLPTVDRSILRSADLWLRIHNKLVEYEF